MVVNQPHLGYHKSALVLSSGSSRPWPCLRGLGSTVWGAHFLIFSFVRMGGKEKGSSFMVFTLSQWISTNVSAKCSKSIKI